MNEPLRAISVAAIALCACSRPTSPPPPPAPGAEALQQAATAAPTLATITVDGQFADWAQVSLNPLQVTDDGTSIVGAGCYPNNNSDRDCSAISVQRDITRFVWTYDATNIYTVLERPPSAATLTYSFIMDVDADGLATASDRVLQVDWKTGGRVLGVKLYRYAPASGSGDAMACPNAASCPSALNPNAAVGLVDGYKMPGGIGVLLWEPAAPIPACGTSGPGDECGGDGQGNNGTSFEVSVPWAQLGVPQGSPIFWHVTSSTNTNFNSGQVDNVGGPDGLVGTFGVFGMDFVPDRFGFAASPGTVDHCHVVTNTGNFTDAYDLRAVSSSPASVTFFVNSAGSGGCTAGAQMAFDSNGDGDFVDPGESVAPAFDTNSDGRPDTGAIDAGVAFDVLMRLSFGAGLSGTTDQTVATARSLARPALVFDTVTDRTRLGPVTVIPDLARTGTPGTTVSFGPHTVRNNQGIADTFGYFITSSRGWAVELRADAAGAPGALLALDGNGDGTWDALPDPAPSTGSMAPGTTRTVWVSVSIPAGTSVDTVDSITLTVRSLVTPATTGSAFDTLTVLSGLTLSPSYTSPSSQLIGAAGSRVFLPHVAINSLATTNTVSLSQTGTLAAGYTIRWWTDPNGDGNPTDGTLITAPFVLQPNGGTARIVTEIGVPASGMPLSTAAVTTVTGQSATTASANDHVAIGQLQTFVDPLFVTPSRTFEACAPIYARAVGLTALQATNYQLRFSNPAGTTVQNDNLPTNSQGVGSGSYTLTAADAPGSWRVRVFSGVTQIYDLNPVTVERAGTVSVVGPAAAVSGQAFPVSATLTNTAAVAGYTGTSVTFVLRDPANAVVDSDTAGPFDVARGATVNAFGSWASPALSTYGNYTVTATWTTSCGSTIASSSTLVPHLPPAPTLVSPAAGATLGTTTPVLSGSAQAGATVRIWVDGAVAGTVIADGAGAFSFTTAALGQGAHSWTADQTVGSVTGPQAATRGFTVDTVVPAAPVVNAPAAGSISNAASPTYSGTAEPGTTVRVFVDGVQRCTATTAAGGAWSCVQPTPLADGSHSVNATATDAANNTSPVSNTNAFTIDTAAPAAPLLTAPASGSATNDTTPAYSGTAEPFSTVTVTVDGASACVATATAAGAWSCTAAMPLGQGAHTATATATDAAGNVSPASTASVFTVDTMAPAAPVVTAPSNGEISATATPTYAGTAEPASTVTVSVDGIVRCSAVASAGGAWSCVQPTSLGQGAHSVNAVAADAAGNPSAPSNTNTFTVLSTAPGAPLITSPVAGSSTNDTTPDYQGTSDVGTTVRVSVDGVQVCTATTTAAGTFSCTQPMALAQGPHSVVAVAVNAAMFTSPPSPTIAFTVDTAAPAAPSVTAPADGAQVSTGAPTYSGTAEPGTTVTVSVDGAVACTAVADAMGLWSCAQPTPLGQGPHTVNATARDAAGNVSPVGGTNTFTVDTVAPVAPVVTAPAGGSAGNDSTPAYSGTAEPGSTVTVRVDGSVACTATTSAAGVFSCAQPMPLADGSHTVNATAADAAGNVSPVSNTNTFTVDTAAPVAPVVTAPADGSTANDTTPAYSGTAEPLSTVTVRIDGTVACTAVANTGGAWSCDQPTALAQGPHGVAATATDAAGNPSPASATNAFTIDTAAPMAPVVTAPANGAVTGSATPGYAGTAEPGSTVTVRVDGIAACTATAAASGAFSCTQLTPLAQGPHTVNATATDLAGNVSGPSNTNAFVVDVTAPEPPAVTAPANGSFTNDNTPSYAGTAEAGSTVTVRVDGAVACTATANAAGAWTCDQPTALPDAVYAVTASATDAAGNVSAVSNTNMFSVETGTPPAPVITTPASGSTTNDSTPEYVGTARPSSTVTVSVDGMVACTTTSTASGDFSCAQPASLADGPHTVTATVTDRAGNTSPASAATPFTVDTSAPPAPALTAPAANATVTTSMPVFSGTAEAGSTVRVSVDGVEVCSATATAGGAFTCTASMAVADGMHSAVATATDPAGNTSGSSATVMFSVDTVVIETTIVSGPPALSRSPAAMFTFSSNVMGVTYECSLDGAAFAACANPLALTDLPDGLHTLRVRATQAGGKVDPTPARHPWTIDSLAPAAPVIVEPTEGEQVGFNPPAFEGTAEAGSTVTVIIDGAVAGMVTADASGNWRFTPAMALASGAHVVSATAQDAAGNTSPPAAPVAFTIDTSALDTRIVSGPSGLTGAKDATFDFESSRAGATFECSLDGAGFTACADPVTFSNLPDGRHTLEVRARDGAQTDPTPASRSWTVDTQAPAAPVVLTPAAGDTVGTRTPTVTGTAEPGSTVSVLVDGAVAGTTVADAAGNWSFTLTVSLGDGAHTASARATDPAGNTGATSTPNGFTVDLTALDTFILSGPNAVSRVSSAAFELASNVAAATFECSLDGAAFAACTSVATFTQLADGSHAFAARARAGASVDATPATFTWTIDSTAPNAPVVVEPANGAVIITSRPVVTGTAEARATVLVRIDQQLAGWATANAAGAWSLPLTVALADGMHQADATSRDAAGNLSARSNVNAFTVITATLGAPVITEPANGAVLATGTPTIRGTAPGDSTVSVTVDGAVVGMATASAAGAWSLPLATALADGAHVATARATLGPRTSASSSPVSFRVDTRAPETVIVTGPPASTDAATAELTFGADEDPVTFECSLDQAAFAPCSAALTLPNVELGMHELRARATDAAGNVDATPAVHTWERVAGGRAVSLGGGGCSCDSANASTLFGLAWALGLLLRRRRR